MPRKRRNRRNRRRNYKEKHENETPQKASNIEKDNVETPSNISIKNNIITPLVITPSPIIQNNTIKFHRNVSKAPINQQDFETTPVNPRRSFKRNKINNDRTPNFSNINLLFNIDSPTLSARSQTSLTPKTLLTNRSSSSIPKLHSPGIEKVPLKENVSTQTIFTNLDVGVQYDVLNEPIVETPKISQALLLDMVENTPKIIVTSPNLKTIQADIETVKYAENFRKSIACASNLLSKNPYAKVKNSSDGEISFFASQLYNAKVASTPIDKLLIKPCIEDLNVIEVAKDDAKDVLNRKCSTPKNTRDISLRLLNNKRKPFQSVSPKLNRYVNHTKFCNKSHNISMLRYRSPPSYKVNNYRRLSNDGDSICSVSTSTGFGAKLYLRMKMYGREVAKWSRQLLDLCSWFGIAIKKGFTSFYKFYDTEKSLLESSFASVITSRDCKCEQFRAETDNLSSKIDDLSKKIDSLTEQINTLTTELNSIKRHYEESECNKKKIDCLDQEFKVFKAKLLQFEELKSEVQEMKERMASKAVAIAAPPVAAVPPPPPPPPPLPFVGTATGIPVKVSGRKSFKKEKENSRPHISLSDILNVKLKKTTKDRASPIRRASQQPIVSMEMLKQVKLRPASRPDTPLSLRETSSNCSSVSTSPYSSLTRMLSSVDTNVWKVKRLRRVGAYSLDDISRKNNLRRDETEKAAAGLSLNR